ncbi:btb/poz domain-containing [Anaeramoeba flamelloides]|uniref:Btb/poz domain-containing n=1 Tax=Anaeramoeba flamelloides TaxID=1746091 RepID=A0AAV8ACL1_9EUKA|nr:btb/poz domain-containing [Anaeramoeba flamelloides]
MSIVTIENDIKKIINNSDIADVHFIVGKERFHMSGHRIILSINSKIFYQQFYEKPSLLGENETARIITIEIPEISSKAFQLFLEYLYTKKVKLSREEVWSVLYIAQKYEVYELVELSFNYIISMLSVKTVFEQLEYSIECKQPFLYHKILEFFDKRALEILKTPNCFNHLTDPEARTLLARVANGLTEPVPTIVLFRRIKERGEYLSKSEMLEVQGEAVDTSQYFNYHSSSYNVLQPVYALILLLPFEKLDLRGIIEIHKTELLSDERMFSILASKYCSPPMKYFPFNQNPYAKGQDVSFNFNTDPNNNYLDLVNKKSYQNELLKKSKLHLTNQNNIYLTVNHDFENKNGNTNQKIKYQNKTNNHDHMNNNEILHYSKEIDQRFNNYLSNKNIHQESDFNNKFPRINRKRKKMRKIVALLANDPCSQFRKDVENSISKASQVVTFDLTTRIPLYEELEHFNVIFHYSTIAYTDPKPIGDLLGRFITDGGSLIITPCFSSRLLKNNLDGLIKKLKIVPEINLETEFLTNKANLGNINNANHSIIKNVEIFNGGGYSYRFKNLESNTGRIIATWSDNTPLIIVNKRRKIGKVIYLNFLPISRNVWKVQNYKTHKSFPKHIFNHNSDLFGNTNNFSSQKEIEQHFHEGGELIIQNSIIYASKIGEKNKILFGKKGKKRNVQKNGNEIFNGMNISQENLHPDEDPNKMNIEKEIQTNTVKKKINFKTLLKKSKPKLRGRPRKKKYPTLKVKSKKIN